MAGEEHMSGDHNMNQKPVAWFHEERYKTHFTTDPSEDMIGKYWQPLYTTPQSNNDFKPDWDTVKAFDDRHNEDTAEIERLTKLCYEYLSELTALRAVEQMRAELKQHDPIVGTKTWFSEDGKIIQQELRQSDVYEREWVGLTDEEIIEVLHPLVLADLSDEQTDYEIARAIEAKLKEKNNG